MQERKKLDIPKFNIDDFKEETKDVEKFKQKIEEEKKKTSIKKHRLVFKSILYIISAFFVFFSLIVPLSMHFLFKIHWLIVLVVSLILFPIFFVSIAIFLIKLYLDKNEIQSLLIKHLSKNSIIANIWFPQKTKMRIYRKVDNNEGIGFNIGKARYFVDNKTVYRNQDGFAESDYLYNIPNPILYQQAKLIEKFQKAFNSGKLPFSDEKGILADISLSSEQVQEFKKMKMFNDFKDTTNIDSQYTKFLYISLALNGLFIIAIIIISLVKK